MTARIANYRNITFLQILFLILTISLCLTLLTQKLVNQPVKMLLEHTSAVAKGDWRFIDSAPGEGTCFAIHLPASSRDEVVQTVTSPTAGPRG